MDITRPFFWLLVYLVILYVRPQEYVPALMETPIVPVSLLFATGVWLFEKDKRFDAPQHGLMLALTAVMTLSVLATGWVSGAVNVFVKFIPTLLVFYLVATSVDSTKRFRAICFVLSAMSVVMAVHGIEQIANPEGIGWTGAKTIQGRITYVGFLNDPNDLSMAFLISLPLTLYLAGITRSTLLRYLCYGAAGVTLYGIYLCNSRGSILGLVAMLGVYVWRRYGMVRGLLLLPIPLAVLAIYSPSRSAQMTVDEASAAGRVDAWYAGFEMFLHRPVLGVGTGLFVEHNRLTAHNSYVLAMAEMGVVGYFVWITILAVTGYMLSQLLTTPEPPPIGDQAGTRAPGATAPVAPARQDPSWAEVQGAAAALTYAFAGALVTAFFLSRTYVVLLYLLLALIVAIHQMARRHWPALAPVRVGAMFGRLVTLTFGSIAGLWVITRVLLSFG